MVSNNNKNNKNNNNIVGELKLVGLEDNDDPIEEVSSNTSNNSTSVLLASSLNPTDDDNDSIDSIDLLPSAEDILTNLIHENQNQLEEDEQNDPTYEPSDTETELGEYMSDDEDFERNLVYNSCLTYVRNLRTLIQNYHRISGVMVRRKQVLRLRHETPSTFPQPDVQQIYVTDPILTHMNQWLEILRKRFIIKLDHFNDTFLINLMFNDRYGTPLILDSVHTQKNFRHRIINFLSRCRTRRYSIERVVSFVELLLSSFNVLKSRMLNPPNDNDTIVNNENNNVNENVIILD